MLQTPHSDQQHCAILQDIAQRVMIERGLLPDFSNLRQTSYNKSRSSRPRGRLFCYENPGACVDDRAVHLWYTVSISRNRLTKRNLPGNTTCAGRLRNWSTAAKRCSTDRRDVKSKEATIVCIRVLIADDRPRSRRSLKALLTAMRWSTSSHAGQPPPFNSCSVEVVGEAEDGLQAVQQVLALLPDVVVMDLQLHTVSASEPRLNGLATIQVIKSTWPAIRIVVLTMYATDRASVLAAGADAFLLKGCPTTELLDAVIPRPAGRPG